MAGYRDLGLALGSDGLAAVLSWGETYAWKAADTVCRDAKGLLYGGKGVKNADQIRALCKATDAGFSARRITYFVQTVMGIDFMYRHISGSFQICNVSAHGASIQDASIR